MEIKVIKKAAVELYPRRGSVFVVLVVCPTFNSTSHAETSLVTAPAPDSCRKNLAGRPFGAALVRLLIKSSWFFRGLSEPYL